MAPSLSEAQGAGLERSCGPDEWVDARRPTEGVEFVLHPDEPHDGRADGPGVFGYRQIYVSPGLIAAAQRAFPARPAPLPFAAPVSDDAVLARVVRTAFATVPEPLALDALLVALAAGLTRCGAADRARTLRGGVDLPAVERGRDFLESRLTIVRSSEVEAVTGLDRYQFDRATRAFKASFGLTPGRYVKLCAAG